MTATKRGRIPWVVFAIVQVSVLAGLTFLGDTRRLSLALLRSTSRFVEQAVDARPFDPSSNQNGSSQAHNDTLVSSSIPPLSPSNVKNEHDDARSLPPPLPSSGQHQTLPKLFPADTSMPQNFLTDIPYAPWLVHHCSVKFRDSEMSLCVSADHDDLLQKDLGPAVVRRLLEHRYECSASSLPIVNVVTDKRPKGICLWVPPMNISHLREGDHIWGMPPACEMESVPPSKVEVHLAGNQQLHDEGATHPVLFLVTFLFNGYIPLLTTQVGYPHIFCYVSSIGDVHRLPENNSHGKVERLSFNQTWPEVFAQARLCDYLAADNLKALAVADSMGLPAMAIGNASFSPRHAPHPATEIFNQKLYSSERQHKHALTGHNVSRAQSIVNSFPLHLFETLSEPVPPPRRHNTTLVILLGNLRGGEVAWQSIYRHLLDVNNADLALMIGETNKSTRIQSPFQRASYIWEFKEYADWADAVDEINGPSWRTDLKAFAKTGTFGGIGNYTGSGAIIFMARFWLSKILVEQNLTQKYDRFVLTRADLVYKCDHNISELDPRYLWVVNGENYGGITDRHWIFNYHFIPKALAIFENLFKNPQRFVKRGLRHNPEQLIMVSWRMDGIYPHQVRRFPRMMYVGYVRGVDSSRWVNQRKRWGKSEEGVNIKYVTEHSFAKCYCEGGNVYNISPVNNAWQDYHCNQSVTPK